MTEPVREPHHVQSLKRGLAVIRAFDAQHPELTLSEVARICDLTRAAARRFLLTLADLGYVRTDGRLFSLTPRVLELGYAFLSSESPFRPVEARAQTSSGEVRNVRSVSEPLETQAQLSKEIADLDGAPGDQPRLDYPPYRSSVLRHPTKSLVHADPETIELWAPCFGHQDVGAAEADLTIQHSGEPLGERIIVSGRVLDGDGRPVAHQLVEVWQANAGGRYIHKRDQHPAPLDPNFTGLGRCLTGADGTYRFQTIKPGPYPWRNHRNAWRPAHIHFSLFGTEFTQRLVTQMYFPGDQLFPLDPIYQSITDPAARERLIATYDHELTQPEYATGYRWDIVLTGGHRTWTETA